MNQALQAIHDFAPLLTAFLTALAAFLGVCLTISEKLANNPGTQANGIKDFFTKATAALSVAKEVTEETEKASEELDPKTAAGDAPANE